MLAEAAVEFQPPLRPGILMRRYKRFLADVETAAGKRITIHCPNTGAMLGCADPGSPIWYSTSANERRKYRHTLELVQSAEEELICVHSARANSLMLEAAAAGLLPGVPATAPRRREVAVPDGHGRIDLHLGDVFVEVKAVTLKLEDGGAFPDAVSKRATRHVETLQALVAAGHRAMLAFCVLHNGIATVRPADEIDPAYGTALRRAAAAGVQVVAVRCRVSPTHLTPVELTPVSL